MSKNMQVLDLFAGVGGMALGLELCGMSVKKSIDIDKNCKKTFDLNFNHDLDIADISEMNPSEIEDFDILSAGFPCQPFSIAGYREGFNDSGRGDLFFNIVDILKSKQPKVFLLENVKNLASHNKGETMNIIYRELEGAGYTVQHKVMNTCEYSTLPQGRERVFIVGFLNKTHADRFVFPEKTNNVDSISSILENNIGSKYYYDERYKITPMIKEAVTKKEVAYQWRRKYVRENKSGVIPTLTANMGTGGHNVPLILDDKGVRKLTPRECFNAQGFPASYKLPEIADGHLYKQAGNSVSVPLVESVGRQIIKALGEEVEIKHSFAKGQRVHLDSVYLVLSMIPSECYHQEDPSDYNVLLENTCEEIVFLKNVTVCYKVDSW